MKGKEWSGKLRKKRGEGGVGHPRRGQGTGMAPLHQGKEVKMVVHPSHLFFPQLNSPLHKIKWLRIILDEGHTIRNKRTTLAKSVLELVGERRWVVTGTPIQNRIDDLWVLLLFLRLEPFNDRKWWKTMIVNIRQRRERRLAELADL